MGEMADMTFDLEGYWPYEEEREDEGSAERIRRISKRDLMRMIKTKRTVWERWRLLARLQKHSDEAFYIAIGRETLIAVYKHRKGLR